MKRINVVCRAFLLLFVLIKCGFLSYAQPLSKPIVQKYSGYNLVTKSGYPEGSTRTITNTTNDKLESVITEEIRDDHGTLYEKITWKKSLTGELEVTWEYKYASGKPFSTVEYKFDNTGKSLEYYSIADFNFSAGKKSEAIKVKADDSQNQVWVEKETRERLDHSAVDEIAEDEREAVKRYSELEKIIKENPGEPASPKEHTGIYKPGGEIRVGYSYLSGQVNNDMTSFPLGANIAFMYKLNDHIEIGAGYSYHRKKEEYQTLYRGFILANGQYDFGNTGDEDKNAQIDGHILAGIGLDKIKFVTGSYSNTSSGNGFAAGAGIGLEFKLNPAMGIRLQTDFIGVKYKNSDELNKNIRANLNFYWKVL